MFDAEQIKTLEKLAEKRPRLRVKLTKYARHVARIHTINRVLDPADKDALFNPNHGSEETLKAEAARRQAELPQLVAALSAALKKAPAAVEA